MKRLTLAIIVCGLTSGLSGCSDTKWGWRETVYDLFSNVCRGSDNCYSTCPDGSRTSTSNPNCLGETAQRQPSPL